MLILTLRTDKPEAEIGLYENTEQLAYETWQAHRALAETLHRKIDELLKTSSKSLTDLEGIVVYEGPGSFTGLRIGLSVANALSYSFNLPITAKNDAWIENGIQELLQGGSKKPVVPNYGGEVYTTAPRK